MGPELLDIYCVFTKDLRQALQIYAQARCLRAPVVDPATGDVIMLFQRTGARSADLKPDNNYLTRPT